MTPGNRRSSMRAWARRRPPRRRARASGLPGEAVAIPSTMRAVAIDRFGPPSVMSLRTVPVPEIGPNEVLLAMRAAGVGIWDAKIRDGTWATGEERFPLVLGTDGVGVVVAKGASVRRLQL